MPAAWAAAEGRFVPVADDRRFELRKAATAASPAIYDDRSPEEYTRFLRGMRSVHALYAHPHVVTLRMDIPIPKNMPQQQTYDGRGWCIFESTLASVVKDPYCLLDRSKFSDGMSWGEVTDKCRAHRWPPRAPPALEAHLRSGMAAGAISFGSEDDLDMLVLPNYTAGFVNAMRDAKILAYRRNDWGDTEVVHLMEALTFAHERLVLRKLVILNLGGNHSFADVGCAAISDTLARGVCVALERLVVSHSRQLHHRDLKAVCKSRGIKIELIDSNEKHKEKERAMRVRWMTDAIIERRQGHH